VWLYCRWIYRTLSGVAARDVSAANSTELLLPTHRQYSTKPTIYCWPKDPSQTTVSVTNLVLVYWLLDLLVLVLSQLNLVLIYWLLNSPVTVIVSYLFLSLTVSLTVCVVNIRVQVQSYVTRLSRTNIRIFHRRKYCYVGRWWTSLTPLVTLSLKCTVVWC